MLGVDLVKMSRGRQIDRAMMLAADGNFICAVQTAKDAGVSTRLCYSYRQHVSDLMLDVFDERLVITDDLIKHCLLPDPDKNRQTILRPPLKGLTFQP